MSSLPIENLALQPGQTMGKGAPIAEIHATRLGNGAASVPMDDILAASGDVSALQENIDELAATKADKTALQAEETARANADGNLQTQINGKADDSDLQAEAAARAGADGGLQTQITGLASSKADASALNSLATKAELSEGLAAKAGTATATQSANGLMSSVDKTKLDGMSSSGGDGLPSGGSANDVLARDASNDPGWKTPAALADTLPRMSASQFGVAKVGTGLAIDAGGVLRATGGGTGGGVTDHNDLTGRDDPDQHPQSAISGLEDDLDGLDSRVSAAEIAVVGKADATEMAAALLDKADAGAMATALAGKADVSALAAKADTDTVNAALATKADATATAAALADKASVASVAAKQNQVTFSTTDLTAGTSALPTGDIYLVYE